MTRRATVTAASQLETIGPEAISLDDIGTSGNVSAMNVGQQRRVLQANGIKAIVNRDAPAVQDGAHRSV
jgi:hypothetical protein